MFGLEFSDLSSLRPDLTLEIIQLQLKRLVGAQTAIRHFPTEVSDFVTTNIIVLLQGTKYIRNNS
jgi:hypothetical protein